MAKKSLHPTSKKGARHTVQLLMDPRADVKGQDCDGRTPLHTAGKFSQMQLVGPLLSGGAGVTVINNGASLHDTWG